MGRTFIQMAVAKEDIKNYNIIRVRSQGVDFFYARLNSLLGNHTYKTFKKVRSSFKSRKEIEYDSMRWFLGGKLDVA